MIVQGGLLFFGMVADVPVMRDFSPMGQMYVFVSCVSLAALIVCWMPTQALMQMFHQTGFVTLLCGGCLFGLAAALIVDHGLQTEERQGVGPGLWAFDQIAWSLCVYGSLLGGLCSSLAWIFRRPDMDQSSITLKAGGQVA
ncbi:hypothetical protein CSW58_12240 [Caulobacter sp. B11]|nr:hypothetical protein CSW58_12240 [Caulobacter sp. B11]